MEEAGLRWGSGWALTVSRIFLGRRKSIWGRGASKVSRCTEEGILRVPVWLEW